MMNVRQAVKWALMILVVGLSAILHLRWGNKDPEIIVRSAQSQLRSAASYRFRFLAKTVVDYQENQVGHIAAEFVQPDHYHLQGKIYDYSVNLYRSEARLVFLDPGDNTWKDSPAAPNLIKEAVPFVTSPIDDFLACTDHQLISCRRDKGKRICHFSCTIPETANQHWRIFFSSFRLDSYISYPDDTVQQLCLSGADEKLQGNLVVEIVFYDYGQLSEIVFPGGGI